MFWLLLGLTPLQWPITVNQIWNKKKPLDIEFIHIKMQFVQKSIFQTSSEVDATFAYSEQYCSQQYRHCLNDTDPDWTIALNNASPVTHQPGRLAELMKLENSAVLDSLLRSEIKCQKKHSQELNFIQYPRTVLFRREGAESSNLKYNLQVAGEKRFSTLLVKIAIWGKELPKCNSGLWT